MKLYESGQDYLESILILSKKLQYVRSIDVANDMNVTKQSAHRAIKNLKENNYISIDSNGYITLTELGFTIANTIYERHVIISKFLISIGVPENIALEDACKLEHDLSSESFEAIKRIITKL